MDWPFGASEVSLFFSPAGLLVVAPFPDGSFRIVATIDNAPEHPSLQGVQAHRLKQSGMFWTVRGGNAILALRCFHLNGRFEDYWEARRAA